MNLTPTEIIDMHLLEHSGFFRILPLFDCVHKAILSGQLRHPSPAVRKTRFSQAN